MLGGIGEGEVVHGGELLDRFWVAKLLILHHKFDSITPFVAPKTVKDLFGGTDYEARGILLVERAEGFVVGAGLFELDVVADHIHDVDDVFELFDGAFFYHRAIIV